jgi:hypothetical protein
MSPNRRRWDNSLYILVGQEYGPIIRRAHSHIRVGLGLAPVLQKFCRDPTIHGSPGFDLNRHAQLGTWGRLTDNAHNHLLVAYHSFA